MIPNNLDALAWRARFTDLLREAEKARLVLHVRAGQERRNHFHHRALTWLGCQLVAWGRRLQERHGAATVAPLPRVVDRCR